MHDLTQWTSVKDALPGLGLECECISGPADQRPSPATLILDGDGQRYAWAYDGWLVPGVTHWRYPEDAK